MLMVCRSVWHPSACVAALRASGSAQQQRGLRLSRRASTDMPILSENVVHKRYLTLYDRRIEFPTVSCGAWAWKGFGACKPVSRLNS